MWRLQAIIVLTIALIAITIIGAIISRKDKK